MRTQTRAGEILAIDVVNINVSKALRESIATATRSPKTSHLLLDVHAVPVIQGISCKSDLLRVECNSIIKTIYDNGIVVLCPEDV